MTVFTSLAKGAELETLLQGLERAPRTVFSCKQSRSDLVGAHGKRVNKPIPALLSHLTSFFETWNYPHFSG